MPVLDLPHAQDGADLAMSIQPVAFRLLVAFTWSVASF
jgi:hypothetical protein